MEVEYSLSAEDLDAFHVFHLYGDRANETGRELFWSLMAIICFAIIVVLSLATRSLQTGLYLVLLLLVPLMALFRGRIALAQTRRWTAKEENAKWMGYRHLQLRPSL
jgi:cell division protein FtsW (lipid II flippase)